jgi:hypothetical protein
MKEDSNKQNIVSQMAWILNYQPTIGQQNIYMGSQQPTEPTTADAAETQPTEPTTADAAAEPTEPTSAAQQPLNLFAPKKNLQELLRGAWFAEVRSNARYDAAWTDAFVEALMQSEHGEEIAREWAVKGERSKRTQLKAYVAGLLKDAGVLRGSYDAIAAKIDPNDQKRSFSRYMSQGKRQPYADWVLENAQNI